MQSQCVIKTVFEKKNIKTISCRLIAESGEREREREKGMISLRVVILRRNIARTQPGDTTVAERNAESGDKVLAHRGTRRVPQLLMTSVDNEHVERY